MSLCWLATEIQVNLVDRLSARIQFIIDTFVNTGNKKQTAGRLTESAVC